MVKRLTSYEYHLKNIIIINPVFNLLATAVALGLQRVNSNIFLHYVQ